MKGVLRSFFSLLLLVSASLILSVDDLHAQTSPSTGSAGANAGATTNAGAAAAVLVDSDSLVNWEFSSAHASGNQYTLIFKAHIRDGWKLFSTTSKDEQPNSRVVLDSSGVQARILRIVEKGTLMDRKDTLFGELKYFEKEVELQVEIEAGGKGGQEGSGGTAGQKTADLKGSIAFMANRGDDFQGPVAVPFRYAFDASGGLVVKSNKLQESAAAANDIRKTSIDLKSPVNSCGGTGTEDSQSKSLAGIFLLGILGGFVALIMPCTFPMITLTVSFFTKRSASRSKGIFNAILYGFFIFAIYVLISVPFYFLKSNSSSILNNISTNVWLNSAFSIIFLVFALSFFGLFEITLPSSVSNSVDSKSGIGTLGGIFFMALTLAIVSFSCTGPILGTLLVGALGQGGGAIQLTVAMAGFGLALGLPFALFALFPGWLQSLPRSGGWMNSVKIVFGFVEVALALKYLSNADLVTHWGLLKRETFIALWILIGIALVLYLFGILKFKHDPPPEKLSKGRIGVALVFLAFVIYMLPGLTNTKWANLSLLSGIVPPLNYSVYHSGKEEINGHVINDYEAAIRLAKEQHKPVLIDFTGWACSNCRRMEENVWPDPAVKAILGNDYILVSLYVDDRKVLPDDQQFLFTSDDGSKTAIKTIGDKYATFQSENFKKIAQPLYAIVSPDEKLLNVPVAYTPDPKEYAAWLQCGLDAYRKSSH